MTGKRLLREAALVVVALGIILVAVVLSVSYLAEAASRGLYDDIVMGY